MPELPEVEVVCQRLKHLLCGHKILNTFILDHRLRFPVPDLHSIHGYTVKQVKRSGKNIILIFDRDNKILINLGMTGKIRLQKSDEFTKHDILYCNLSNEYTLVLNDVRRFGFVVLNPNLDTDFVEPLSDSFNEYYVMRYQHLTRSVKSLLMDKRFVLGIGNIYANEILFSANILPSKQVKQVDLSKIITPAKQILKQAISYGGTTIKDFSALEKPGTFQTQLKVYNRTLCFKCNSKIIKIKLMGRSTYFCRICQT